MNKRGSSIYDILVFGFADTQTADAVVNELKAPQKLKGYKANVVTVALGVELSGTIAQSTEAGVQAPASQTGQAAKATSKQ